MTVLLPFTSSMQQHSSYSTVLVVTEPHSLHYITCSVGLADSKAQALGIRAKQYVKPNATTEMAEQISITSLSPKVSAAGANNVAPSSAPALPAAAATPFSVDRHSWE